VSITDVQRSFARGLDGKGSCKAATIDMEDGVHGIQMTGTGNDLKIQRYRSINMSGTEFSVGTGNRLTLSTKPDASAGTRYSGSGVIDSPEWRSFTPTVTTASGTPLWTGGNSLCVRD